MRNVNDKSVRNYNTSNIGFILTMRNVNKSIEEIKREGIRVLY